MFKNVASQKFWVFAFDSTTGVGKTGDAANITAYVSKDYGAVTVLTDTSATEADATNAKGWYLFDAAQAETNADCLLLSGKSTTSNIQIVGQVIYTDPPSYTSFVTPTNLTAAQIATGVWQDTTAGDFTVASSIGKSLYTGNVAPGGTNGLFIAGTNAATTITTALTTTFTGNLTGSVGSVTGAVGSVTGAVASVTGNVGGNVTGSVGSVTGLTASDVGAIKTKTDSLTFTVANVVDSNMLRTNGDATAAANVAKTTRAICRGTITTGTSATSFAATGIVPASSVNDQFKGRIVTFDADTTTTALRGQATDITAYTHATATFTVTALTSTPAIGDTFSVT